MEETEFTTPMMKQYMEIKKQYPDCLLFFRLGDFYELFLDDALIGHKVLDITLTGRPRGKDGRIPMAGVPFHAVDSYLAKLVKAGYKVAICEQVTEPDKNGIVEREVIRVVTPGTVLDEKTLNNKENNYIISLSLTPKIIGIACADISTGEFKSAEYPYTDLSKTIIDLLTRISPSECILSEKDYNNRELLKILSSLPGLNTYCYLEWERVLHSPEKYLQKELKLTSLYSTGLDNKKVATLASAALFAYLKETQKDKLYHITTITQLLDNSQMSLDRATIINLELFSPLRETTKIGTLISILDQTQTSGGARMLRQWIAAPLTNESAINERLSVVEHFVKDQHQKESIQVLLKPIPDIERTLSRLSVGIGNARDLISIRNGLVQADHIAQKIKDVSIPLLQTIHNELLQNNVAKEITDLITDHILDDPAFDPKDGGLIKKGIHKELDTLRSKSNAGKEWIAKLEIQERERTGISSLKVRYNKVFGFYIEVSNSNLSLIPKDYMRKQTLVNGERFITPELKEQEEIILNAEEKSKQIEYEIFLDIQKQVIAKISPIQHSAQALSQLDCLISFAQVAIDNRYTKPTFTTNGAIEITDGRHPVVEKLLDQGNFVPNGALLNAQENQLLLITGPNMAGKSVYMRQVALIVLMAQIGCFVPAKAATLTPVDKIFVRSGASDMIASGLSTFMVEMVETAYILQHATNNSLIIMDEIGRGTSTYDGISIAWAIAEYIVKNTKLQTKTLFATHYHELQKLEEEYPEKIKNYHMAIQEEEGRPIFLHTIKPGGAAHSFGVAVAKLAGIPQDVIKSAEKMLHELETRAATQYHVNEQNNTHHHQESKETINTVETGALSKEQLTFAFSNPDDPIIQELQELDIHQMTPLQALNKLAEIKNKLKIMQYTNRDFSQAD